MAPQKQAEVIINQDRLHHKERSLVHVDWYLAKQEKQGLIAYAWLDTVEPGHWPHGIVIKDAWLLTYKCEPVAKGDLSLQQEALAETMVDQFRARLVQEMHAAGWRVVAKTKPGRDIWQFQEQGATITPAQQATYQGKPISQASDQGRQSRNRVVYTRPITFTCVWCKQQVTEERFPSHTPLYCSKPACKVEATRVKTRERVTEWRKTHPDARKKKKA